MSTKPILSVPSRALDTVAACAVIMLAGAVLWSMINRGDFATRPKGSASGRASAEPRRAIKPPRDAVSLDGAPTLGKTTAPAALIEYADFQCPFCGAFARETFPVLRKDYIDTGKVLMVFRNMPLPIHSFANIAAEGAECAAAQNRFWPMHDRLFEAQQTLSAPMVDTLADGLGLDKRKYTACMKDYAPARVRADLSLAKEWGVSSTPTFFAGVVQPNKMVRVTAVLEGNQRADVFRKTLDDLVK